MKNGAYVVPAVNGGYLLMIGSSVIAKTTTEIGAMVLRDEIRMGREVKMK